MLIDILGQVTQDICRHSGSTIADIKAMNVEAELIIESHSEHLDSVQIGCRVSTKSVEK